MRNLTKALTVVSLLAPVSGYPLGIGDIRVRSALNQNLNAEISLIVSPNENPNSIKVNLAPPERFDSAGVAWSYFLSKIRFKPIVKPNGSVVVKVTSTEALKEPFLNFLLEVSWPKGNLYREFTVLVDPPAEYQEPTYRAEPRYDSYTPQEQVYTPRPRLAYNRPVVRRTIKPRMRAPSNAAGSFGGEITARRNDTLWKVAARAKGGSDVSVEQMMMALYDHNPDAFFQPNVNALSAGRTLHVPAKSTVQQITRQQALAEFGRHNQAWVNHSGVPEAEETQVAKEQPVESQLKLVAPTESSVSSTEKVAPSSEQAAASGNPSATNVTSGQKGASETTAKEVNPAVDQAVQSKLDALQKQLETMQQIIALKDKQLADLQNSGQPPVEPPPVVKPQPVTPPAVEQKPVETVPPVAATTTRPVEPVEAVKPVPVPPKPIAKSVLTPEPVPKESDSSYLGIIGGTVLAFLSLLGWIWWRKQKMLSEIDAESMFGNYSIMRNNEAYDNQPNAGQPRPSPGAIAAGSGAAALAEESSFLNDFKASDFESFETFNVDHGDIDPVAEADVYLAYGRYQQAEELMKDAVKSSPDRDECKLKLLEIYQVSGNKEAFEKYGEQLVAAGKNKERDFWDKVTELGKDILPESEMFAVDHTPAVFATGAESVAENVLVSPAQETESTPKNQDDSDFMGSARFEVDDSAGEESTFASSLYRETEPQEDMDEFAISVPETHAGQKNVPLETAKNNIAEVDDITDLDDNDSIDFNLGPYPDVKQNGLSESASAKAKNVFVNAENANVSDNAIARKDLDAYEFDLDFEKPELNSPISSAKHQATDSWDPDQTIDFSFDTSELKVEPKATSAEETLDFNFDVEMPSELTGSPAKSNEFNVSDLTDMDEVETKLDLAKAYVDMGDPESAKEIIAHVIEKGSAEQKQIAQLLLKELS